MIPDELLRVARLTTTDPQDTIHLQEEGRFSLEASQPEAQKLYAMDVKAYTGEQKRRLIRSNASWLQPQIEGIQFDDSSDEITMQGGHKSSEVMERNENTFKDHDTTCCALDMERISSGTERADAHGITNGITDNNINYT
eukprot:jgi/Psemu1/18958/gm1.18958_g